MTDELWTWENVKKMLIEMHSMADPEDVQPFTDESFVFMRRDLGALLAIDDQILYHNNRNIADVAADRIGGIAMPLREAEAIMMGKYGST